MAPHQILLVPPGRGALNYVYRFADLEASHHTDGLRRLCRQMAARGLLGAAELRSENGKLRLTVRAVEHAARWALTENDQAGFQLTRYASHPLAEARRRHAAEQKAGA